MQRSCRLSVLSERELPEQEQTQFTLTPNKQTLLDEFILSSSRGQSQTISNPKNRLLQSLFSTILEESAGKSCLTSTNHSKPLSSTFGNQKTALGNSTLSIALQILSKGTTCKLYQPNGKQIESVWLVFSSDGMMMQWVSKNGRANPCRISEIKSVESLATSQTFKAHLDRGVSIKPDTFMSLCLGYRTLDLVFKSQAICDQICKSVLYLIEAKK